MKRLLLLISSLTTINLYASMQADDIHQTIGTSYSSTQLSSDPSQLFYHNGIFDIKIAQRALLTEKVGDCIVQPHFVISLMNQESQQSGLVQLALYNILTNKIGFKDFRDNTKAQAILNLGLSQNWAWAHSAQGQIFKTQSDEKSALKSYILAAHQDHKEAIKQVDKFYGDALNNLDKRIEFELIKHWKNEEYGIPLFNLYLTTRNIKYLRAAADIGYVLAQSSLANNFFESKDTDKSFHYFKKAAKQNCHDSQCKLGDLYYHGYGRPKPNKEKALYWYLRAAQQGISSAQYNVGQMFQTGDGCSKPDMTQAYKWYLKSAQQGYADAQLNLGLILHNGFEGYPANLKEAYKWYSKSAQQSHSSAQNNLAVLLEEGFDGQAPDLKQALKWYIKSAEQGYPYAQYAAGNLLEKGFDEQAPDLKQAMKWYIKSAEQGHVESQCKLGFLYAKGCKDQKLDYSRAIKYWQMAVNQNHDHLLLNLAVAFEKIGQSQKSLKIYFGLIKKNDFFAMNNAAILLSVGFKGQKPDKNRAHQLLQCAADAGIPEAQTNLSKDLIEAQNKFYLEDRHAQIVDLLHKAIEQNFVPAMTCLADYYTNFSDKENQILFWLEKAQASGEQLATQYLNLIDKIKNQENQNDLKTEKQQTIDTLDKEINDLSREIQSLHQQVQLEYNHIDVDVKAESVLTELTNFPVDNHIKDKNQIDTNIEVNVSDDQKYFSASLQSYLEQNPFHQPTYNPKFRREQLRKAHQIKDIRLSQQQIKPFDDKHQITVDAINNTDIKAFSFNGLQKLFHDPYFNGQVILSETKSGLIVSAHNIKDKNYFTASTHRAHQRKQNGKSISVAFLHDLKSILNLFNL